MDTKSSKSCNFCGEEIANGLRRCPYCGSLLNTKALETLFEQKSFQNSIYEINAAQMCVEQSDDGSIIIKECEEITRVEQLKDVENNSDSNDSRIQPIKPKSQSYAEGKTLSNGMKVFLTVLSTLIPGLGQLIGIIVSVVLMNSDNKDKNSFGLALMIACLIFFVLSFFTFFITMIALSVSNGFNF